MTEILALLVVAALSFLDRRTLTRRLDDAYAELTAAHRQLRVQADPTAFHAAMPAEHRPLPVDQFWLTDASGLITVPLES